MSESILPLIFDGNDLKILDQRLLPGEIKYNIRNSAEDVFYSIRDMELRGAPLIGIAAAYGMYMGIRGKKFKSYEAFLKETEKTGKFLSKARPTAVNLSWAIDRIVRLVKDSEDLPLSEIEEKVKAEAKKIIEEDVEICRNIGENFLKILKPDSGILTHCNAGALATYKYGTATSPMYLGLERGLNFRVYADETRPYNQGARLTAFELLSAGIDVTLICDNMAGVVMSKGKVDAVITGCDRVASNGDTANKIGTFEKALAAKALGVPFYIAAPLSTFDFNCPGGKDIPIEERSQDEVLYAEGPDESGVMRKIRLASPGSGAFNPAFDVTPAALITGFITEKGIVEAGRIEGLNIEY